MRLVVSGMLVAVVAAGAEAQQRPGADRVIAGLPPRYVAPECEAKTDHFKVSSAATYLKTGIETSVEENRQRAIENGIRVVTEAITENDQAQSAGAWYYLGRLHLQKGDIRGADTAFSKVEALAPDCREEVDTLRQIAWVPLVNAGIQFTNSADTDSAKVLFAEANAIYRGKPQAYSALGVIHANAGNVDSAIANFEQAARIAEQAGLAEDRNQATFNVAIMYSQAGRHAEAATALERYVAWAPDDIEAKRALASAYRASGQAEKAQAIDKEIVAAGGTATGTGGAASADVFNVGVTAFNEKRYEDAATAFNQVVEREPWNRDAWYNLANSYLAQNDGAGVARAAEKLLEIEPMNEDAVKLYGQGLRDTKQQEKQLEVVERLLAMPITVEVSNFTRSNGAAVATGKATGREAMTAAGKKLKPAPVTLVFEFLDGSGNVVATQEVAVPALPPGQTHEIKARGEGKGIIAWRYKRAGSAASGGA